MSAEATVAEREGFKVQGWAARDSSGHLAPFSFTRRKTGPEDVTLKILYCGICHSDLHQIRNEWEGSIYPMVPGHEIVGTVVEVGTEAKNFKVGEHVGIGCLVDSCRSCENCNNGLEQYCPSYTLTYNSIEPDGSTTYGGFSALIVCNYRFVVKVPTNIPLDEAAPLLCAGITVYSPLKHFGMTEVPGKRLGVVGLGGLGHMAIKFGKAFGLHVTVISTSSHKEKEAKERMGADAFLLSRDETLMKNSESSLDFIIDTVSADHSVQPLLKLLKTDGKLVVLGAPQKPLDVPASSLLFGRRMVAGSLIGGLKETQEMLDFCGEHKITCVIEKISMDYVNTAMQRLSKGDVKYRFVIDIEQSFRV
eukprot:TRINITY_DN16868_c0_g2_i1.p1 TRINITY_DN16868_c0_g2~~TRINITY_DN16868_c0_g2_i1.p1  ORF type:complete len:371 (+),score=58.99 TRINITY_DN16868_c0_g2_i1:26-1114(+)